MLHFKQSTGITLLRAKLFALLAGAGFFAINTVAAFAQQPAHQPGGEANLQLPDLSQVTFMGGTNGRTLLMSACSSRR
jgi:Na+/proline symporter